jgi:G8 domain
VLGGFRKAWEDMQDEGVDIECERGESFESGELHVCRQTTRSPAPQGWVGCMSPYPPYTSVFLLCCIAAGTVDSPMPVGKTATIILYGGPDALGLPQYGAKTLAMRDGRLELYGAPKLPPWTHLMQTVHEGDDNITIQGLANWQVGTLGYFSSTALKYWFRCSVPPYGTMPEASWWGRCAKYRPMVLRLKNPGGDPVQSTALWYYG